MSLNKEGVALMLADMFRADTAVLYGQSGYVQDIVSDEIEYLNSSIDITKPYKIFLKCSPSTTDAVRMQNEDVLYQVEFRIEGCHQDPRESRKQLDLAEHRMRKLINTQMYDGDTFTDFYTDSSARILDVEMTDGDLGTEEREGRVVVEDEGIINVFVNRDQ